MKRILELAFLVYVALAILVFTPYYNWQYAKTNGFMRWITLGQVVPTMKAAIWPYYVFSPAPKSKLISVHFVNSLNYSNQAAMLTYEKELNKETFMKMLGMFENALNEGRQVDLNALNEIYPQLGDNFKTNYLTGLESLNGGIKNGDSKQMTRGQNLLDTWHTWYAANVENIRKSATGL